MHTESDSEDIVDLSDEQRRIEVERRIEQSKQVLEELHDAEREHSQSCCTQH